MNAGPSAPSAIILAAGSSRRMGRDKAALPWLGETTLLEWTVATLRAAGWNPVIVTGPHNDATWREGLPDTPVILNAGAASGKVTSLAAGASALPADLPHFLITSVDQPRPPALYRAMREAANQRTESVLVPDRKGRRGHPVVLAGCLRPRLTRLAENSLGLRGLLDKFAGSTYRVPCEADGLYWDLNTPEAYDEALAWFEARAEDF